LLLAGVFLAGDLDAEALAGLAFATEAFLAGVVLFLTDYGLNFFF